jgi:argininosuccinate lyase
MANSPVELRAAFWQALADAAAAHAIMLRDAVIVDDEVLSSLLSAIDNARGSAVPELPFVLLAGKLDDRINAATAPGAAGAAQVGRGQMDLTATALRLVARGQLLSNLHAVDVLSAEMEAFAGAHAVTLMPIAADGVAFQATSLGHIASSLVASLERGRTALITAFQRINRSPLGSGATTGAGFPIDRARAAALLGCNAEVEQTFEALAGVDDFLAIAHATEAIAAPIGRWVDELVMMVRTDAAALALDSSWQTGDWAAPQWAGFGGIGALSAHARKVIGAARSLALVATSLPWGPVTSESGGILSAIDETTSGLDILLERTAALMRDDLIVNRAALASRAGRAFVTSADLADFLIVEESIEPGPARAIAGIVLNRARETGLEISAITPEMIDTAALMVIGREIKVEFEAISRYLAPRRYIERRNLTGGPAPAAVRSWLAAAEARRKQDMEQIAAIEQAIETAKSAREHEHSSG